MDSEAPKPDEPVAAPRISLGKGRALVTVPVVAPRTSAFAGMGRSHATVAAGVALVMGLGFVAGTQVFASKPQAVQVAQAAPPADTAMDVLYRVQGEVRSLKASLDVLRAGAEDGRQTETIRGLKRSVDVLKQDLEGVKVASTTAVGQLGVKIDRLDRDPGPKLAEIASRLDRMDPDAKIAQVASQLTARIDRVERQMAASDATGSIPAQGAVTAQVRAPMPPTRAVQAAAAATTPVATPVPVAALPPTRPESPARVAEPARPEPARPETVAKAEVPAHVEAARPDLPPRPAEGPVHTATVEGWMLRDVYGGVALLEGRAGGLREVAPGEYVPGVGQIRAIERRGRGWVVVTSHGIIQADNRW